MTTYRCTFLFMQVFLHVEMTQEQKHHDEAVLDAACEALAVKLDATYLYRKEITK